MAGRYWVVGGEYSDPAFTEPVPGTTEERLGPFESYRAAHDAWQARAWATVDSCARRYRIIEEAAPEVRTRYWVLGGDYADPDFRTVRPGTQEERIGPFDSYKTAHDAWQARAWATVDSCTKRYRIVEEGAVRDRAMRGTGVKTR
jgi:hypothetical protein